uniref:Rad17 cell cycle checkpoint protein n=1 Tax=Mimivirus LCMiAC01 TaxID=2506608 RepID=A0A481Z027_9VIRU|nr:MAG: Rad17 cell cycle checkpoint protein [Mimivirus LCMiAC01]
MTTKKLLLKKQKILIIEDEDEDEENDITSRPRVIKNIDKSIPWIEKYRPKNIRDVLIDKNTMAKVKRIMIDKDMPNIIIVGVPGVGKTTTIQCIVRCLLGKHRDEGVLERNASDARGIKSVNESIINFCKKKLDIKQLPNRKYATHKIIVLDEADNMTKKAQQLINNLMGKFYSSTRFAFTCNNTSKIIEAIQSRCIIFRYRRLTNEQITKRLLEICTIENVPYTDKGLKALVSTANGDMRHAINNLQLTYYGYKKITVKNVYTLCDKPHPHDIKKIFMACIKKDFINALSYLNVLFDKGYSNYDISLNMKNTIKTLKINETPKLLCIDIINQTLLSISKGIDSKLQLTGCIAELCMAIP